MTPYGYIYITTNTTNGKKYIGQNSYSAKSTERYLGSGKYLKLAIKKYGRLCFKKEVLFVSFSLDDLNWAEKHFIAEAQAVRSKDFYNCSPGGKSSLGFTGKTHGDTHRKKMQELLTGVPRTSESRHNQSKTRKERIASGQIKFSPRENGSELARNMGKANLGRTHKKKLCHYCHRMLGPTPYARFHGEKCSLNPENSEL